MVSERLKILFGNVKKRLGEIKPEDIAKLAVKEAVGAIPVVGSIIKDAIDEFSPDEKEELIQELKELSETQFKEISEKVEVSVEYLKDIQRIALYTFEELRVDHEEIKELLLHLIKIKIREVKLPEIDIPTIQSVLRKGETSEGDFFKKEPEWVDFKEGFVVARKEVDEIIEKLENDKIQLVLGEPASGKSVILKNIGFKLANENKDVYIVELKKHSSAEVKRYFDDIPEIKNEKGVFIVDDAHFLPAECERLVRVLKNKKLKAKLIIGSRPTREIREGYPKEVSEFEYLSKTDIHAKDVTEEMIKRFLERKHGLNDEKIEKVSKNLERYKKDLWHLSWALKSYNPQKDSVEEKEIYEKIKDSIRKIKFGKDELGKDKYLNAEDVFLPLSVFYMFEIPVERKFLLKQLEIDGDKIIRLIELSEIIETEEIGRNRMLSLIHSSIADLYFRTYHAYPSLGEKVREKIINQRGEDLEYCLFYKYMTSTDPRNVFDVFASLRGWFIGWFFDEQHWFFGEKEGQILHDEKREQIFNEKIRRYWFYKERGQILLKKLIVNEEIVNSIKKAIKKEEKSRKILSCVTDIAEISKEVALKLIVNEEIVNSIKKAIKKEEKSRKILSCVTAIAKISEEMALKLADAVSSRIEMQKDLTLDRIEYYVEEIALTSEKVAQEVFNCLNPKIISELKEMLREESPLLSRDDDKAFIRRWLK
jgi:hypothetical protein